MSVTAKYYEGIGTADKPLCSGSSKELKITTSGCDSKGINNYGDLGFSCSSRQLTAKIEGECVPIPGDTYKANECVYVKHSEFTGSVEISECTSDGLSGGAIAGIAVGSVVGLILIYYLYKKFGSNRVPVQQGAQ